MLELCVQEIEERFGWVCKGATVGAGPFCLFGDMRLFLIRKRGQALCKDNLVVCSFSSIEGVWVSDE